MSRINRRNVLQLAVGAGSLLIATACSGGAAPTASPAAKPTTAPKPAGTAPAASSPAGPGEAGIKPVAPTAAASAPAKTQLADLNALAEAAKREGGPLTLYSSTPPPTLQPILKLFTDRYGIAVNHIRLASGPLAQRFMSETEAGNYASDVIQIADPLMFEDAIQKGWLAKLDDLPSVADFPSQFKSEYFALATVTPMTIAYNTELVKEPPTTWDELLHPKWKGQFLIVDPRSAPALAAWVLLLQETYGDDFLRKLASQEPRLASSSVPGSQQVAAGAAQLCVPSTHSSITDLIAQGAPIADVIPDPATGNETLMGVPAKAPNPNGAKLLANFLLSPEAQAMGGKDGYYSVLPNLSGQPTLPKSYRSPKIAEAMAKRDQLLPLLGIS